MADASPQNYTLGRGEIWFSLFNEGTYVPKGFRYFGNTPELSITSESEDLDHYSSDRGIREKDDSVMLQLDRTATLTTDAIRPENLALFFLGDANILTVAAEQDVPVLFDDVVPGYQYQLGESAAAPSGARMVTNLVLTDDASTPNTFSAGADYVLNAVDGTIMIVEGGAIERGTNLRGTFDTQASSREVVISGSKPIEGAMKYKAYNPKGKDYDYFFPRVKITPNGDFALKGDEWQTIPFTVEILKKPGYEAMYINGVASTPTP